MKRNNILKRLLADGYEAWERDRLSSEAYRRLGELVMAEADELSEKGVIAEAEWAAIEEENLANLMLVDDVAEL